MRISMSMVLATLESVYYETKVDRELTDDERVERYESFDIGLNKENIDAWYSKRYEQLKASGHYDKVETY